MWEPDYPLQTEFRRKCIGATTLQDFYAISEYFTGDKGLFALKDIYNSIIGWALPSRVVITRLHEAFIAHLDRFPDANFVDFGAGSGVFCYCMQLVGVPKDKIIAFDIPQPTHAMPEQRQFYHITSEYVVKETDFVFIGWGCGQDIPAAKTICILGELAYGCTTNADYFREYCYDDQLQTTSTVDGITWNITLTKAIGPACRHGEYLSINTCW